MANSLIGMLGNAMQSGNVAQPKTLNMNNPMQMIAEFAKFKQSISPQGARQRLEQMLQSGEMTPEQFKQLKEQAQALKGLFI